MAQDIILFDRTYLAHGALNQYGAVKLSSNGADQVVKAGDGEQSVGVVQNGAGGQPGTVGTLASGAYAEVRVHGVTKMLVGSAAAVTAADMVSADTDGNAQTADTGDYVLGVCEQGGASSTLCTVLLLPIGKI